MKFWKIIASLVILAHPYTAGVYGISPIPPLDFKAQNWRVSQGHDATYKSIPLAPMVKTNGSAPRCSTDLKPSKSSLPKLTLSRVLLFYTKIGPKTSSQNLPVRIREVFLQVQIVEKETFSYILPESLAIDVFDKNL